jgi:hypothetical protein
MLTSQVINLIPGCHFRATEEGEIVGMDVSYPPSSSDSEL